MGHDDTLHRMRRFGHDGSWGFWQARSSVLGQEWENTEYITLIHGDGRHVDYYFEDTLVRDDNMVTGWIFAPTDDDNGDMLVIWNR